MKKTDHKIVYSQYDSRRVDQGLDFILKLRDEYLFATIFKGCRKGFDRDEDCYLLNTKKKPKMIRNGFFRKGRYSPDTEEDSEESLWDKMKNWLARKITCQLLLCMIVWYWAVYCYCRCCEISVFDPDFLGIIIAQGLVFWGLIIAAYVKFLAYRSTPVCDDIGSNRVLWRKKEGWIKRISRRIIYSLRRKSTRYMAIANLPLWLITVFCFNKKWQGIFGSTVTVALSISIWVAYYAFYKIWFRMYRVSIYAKEDQDMVLWEAEPGHIWMRPAFWSRYGRKAKLNMASVKYASIDPRDYARGLLEYARDLSWLKCLCRLSEEIKTYTDAYDVEIEIREDDGCNDTDRDGEYTIFLTGTEIGEQDTIIPADVEKKTQSFTLPYIIGKEIVQDYRKTGILNLGTMDDRFDATGGYLRKKKDKMKKSLISFESDNRAEIIQYLEREDIFSGERVYERR